jgi:UDPglucose 6-dehydrogenase
MKICVFGLWHLGSVTAACLASLNHSVTGLDFDDGAVAGLNNGKAPLHEPGLDDLIAQGLKAGRLRFTVDAAEALRGAEALWVAFDTPVDHIDEADVEFVTTPVERIFPLLEDGAVVLVSSQLRVGSTRQLSERFAAHADGRRCFFAYSPENLRLGKAISIFLNPDRIVVGADAGEGRARLQALLLSVSPHLLWTGIESAEMIKHAINAFLATSIVFANEIAAVCEIVGADAREVALGMKSETRIGAGAYVSPGGPFAGGTLARDIAFLTALGRKSGASLSLLNAVRPSNEAHKSWTQRRLRDALPDLRGRSIALLGLTYKAGTDTLRRSAAVELARWLSGEGAVVRAYDPSIASLPGDLARWLWLAPSIESALDGASATVLSFDAPEFKKIDWRAALRLVSRPILIDPSGSARESVANIEGWRYVTVGFLHRDRQGLIA